MHTPWQALNIYLTSRYKTQVQPAGCGILHEVAQKYQEAKMYFKDVFAQRCILTFPVPYLLTYDV